MVGMVGVQGDADLPELRSALGASGGFTGVLYSGEEERDKQCQDGDGHQQLDHRECM